MGSTIEAVWGLVTTGLLDTWLAGALFWALAGAAVASWSRIPIGLGIAAGAFGWFIGVGVLGIIALVRKGSQAGIVGNAGLLHPPAVGTYGSSTSFGGSSAGMGSQATGFDPFAPTVGSDGTVGHAGAGTGDPFAGNFGSSHNSNAPTPSQDPFSFGFPPATSQFGSALQPISIPAAKKTVPLSMILTLVGAVVVGGLFWSTFFVTWLSSGLAGGVDLSAAGVGMTIPLIFTLLATAGSIALCWARPSRIGAVLLAWFSSWWLLLGLLALTAGEEVVTFLSSVAGDGWDSLAASVGESELGQQIAAGTGFNISDAAINGEVGVLGPGLMIIVIASTAALLWAAAVIAQAHRLQGRWRP